MSFQRIVIRTLPDGSVGRVYPFHISLSGMKSLLLCRNDEDYDHLEKSIYLSAYANNAIVVIEIAMSNHAHICLLARDFETAFRVGDLIKKRHSQYLSRVYSEKKTLLGTGLNVQYLDSDRYARNAMAYIARNALDCGSNISEYKWSGYCAMFTGGKIPERSIRVSDLSLRQRRAIFMTHYDLSGVPWVIDKFGKLEPVSACDHEYLESAFAGDQAFFLRIIGTTNPAEMKQLTDINPSSKISDTQLNTIISEITAKWFGKDLRSVTPVQKSRMVFFLYRSYRTTPKQLARCLQMSPEIVESLVEVSRRKH